MPKLKAGIPQIQQLLSCKGDRSITKKIIGPKGINRFGTEINVKALAPFVGICRSKGIGIDLVSKTGAGYGVV